MNGCRYMCGNTVDSCQAFVAAIYTFSIRFLHFCHVLWTLWHIWAPKGNCTIESESEIMTAIAHPLSWCDCERVAGVKRGAGAETALYTLYYKLYTIHNSQYTIYILYTPELRLRSIHNSDTTSLQIVLLLDYCQKENNVQTPNTPFTTPNSI